MCDKRYAYLIMCHDHFEQLGYMLEALDDERNDFYIHVDKKAGAYPKDQILNSIKKGTCEFIESMAVNWGGYSMIQCELALLKAATRTEHAHYHLLSGVDFPIKPQKEILAFFDQNDGKEFIEFCGKDEAEKQLDRVCRFHFFQEQLKRRDKLTEIPWWIIESFLLLMQRIVKIDRLKNQHDIFYKGANWFSITHELALYVIGQEPLIRKLFRWTVCADEAFLQMIAMQSPYKENIVKNSMRMIDWERCHTTAVNNFG